MITITCISNLSTILFFTFKTYIQPTYYGHKSGHDYCNVNATTVTALLVEWIKFQVSNHAWTNFPTYNPPLLPYWSTVCTLRHCFSRIILLYLIISFVVSGRVFRKMFLCKSQKNTHQSMQILEKTLVSQCKSQKNTYHSACKCVGIWKCPR